MKKKESEPKLRSSKKDLAKTDDSPSTSMVDIVVSMKQDDIFANLKVSSFDLILSLEFLLKIAQFITPPEEDTTNKISSYATSSPPNVEKQTVATTSNRTSKRNY